MCVQILRIKSFCVFKISDANQRQASVQKMVEKAKVGRQDTVKTCILYAKKMEFK